MFVTAAFQHVRDNMDEINYHVKAKETDIIFLKTLMDNPTVESLIKVSLIYSVDGNYISIYYRQLIILHIDLIIENVSNLTL